MAGFNLLVLLGLVAAMIALRVLRAGPLAWAIAWLAGVFVFLQFGFTVPVPGSVRTLYMGITTLAVVAYFSSSAERFRATTAPLVRLCVDPSRRWLLILIVFAAPLAIAGNVYRTMSVPLQAPSFGRTIHPAPPAEITVNDASVDLITADNPYRKEIASAEVYAEHLANGRRVYYSNCFYCHGDGMAGDGMFAYGLNPIPTNFTDVGVLPNLQSSFTFWRIAKGAPGMPEEAGPWDSAMPAWENFLTTEEMWDVNLFIFGFNGYEPRAQEVHHD